MCVCVCADFFFSAHGWVVLKGRGSQGKGPSTKALLWLRSFPITLRAAGIRSTMAGARVGEGHKNCKSTQPADL